jgi:hypothetical protein
MWALEMFKRTYGYVLRHPSTMRGYWGDWYYRDRYERVLARLLKICVSEEMTILELGCARGRYAESSAVTGCGYYYIGCDIDARSLRSAYRGLNTDYVLCDIHRLPFIKKCAEVVLCSEVLEHLALPYQVLRSMCELLTRVLILTFPEERPLRMLRDRHPEHVSEIDKEIVIYVLRSEDLRIIEVSVIFSSFIPCGLLEFLRLPRNSFTQTVVSSLDTLLRRLVPSTIVPYKTILIEARPSKGSLPNSISA